MASNGAGLPFDAASFSHDRLPVLLAGLPKAELHIHIEGSLEPELIFDLARRNAIELPYADVEVLRRAYAFTDLQSFLDIYYAGASVLRHERDFYDMTLAYLARAHADHVIHAEIMFDPQTHTQRGVAFETVLNGIEQACIEAQTRWGMSTALIMSFLRHLSEQEAFETLESAMPHRGRIQSIGLDSSERGNPPEKFARVYARCRSLGFRLTAHAGEEGPPAYIRTALDVLKVERIDHGVQCMHEPALVRLLAERRVPLTVCPLSNVKLCVFDSLASHNLRALLDQQVLVTINSDDPAYFGGYIGENFAQTVSALALNAEQAYLLARNSFDASFVLPEKRRRFSDQLDGYVAQL